MVPASGGVPRRLTYHPAAGDVVGWTPDPKAVREGHDPQLEKAVEVVMDRLKKCRSVVRNRGKSRRY